MIPGNYRLICLTSTPENGMGRIPPGILQLHEDKKLNEQHGFSKGKLWQTKLSALHCRRTGSSGKRRAMDVACLDFWEDFDMVSHRDLLSRLERHGISSEL